MQYLDSCTSPIGAMLIYWHNLRNQVLRFHIRSFPFRRRRKFRRWQCLGGQRWNKWHPEIHYQCSKYDADWCARIEMESSATAVLQMSSVQAVQFGKNELKTATCEFIATRRSKGSHTFPPVVKNVSSAIIRDSSEQTWETSFDE